MLETADEGNPTTLTERATFLLQSDILAGAWPPGHKLVIADLVAHYGIGATPLREALSRIVALGLIQAIGQRGFRVAQTSEADLLDITHMRQLVEVQALRLSILRGDADWEAGIVSSLHKIKLYAQQASNEEDFREGARGYAELHRDFHTALLAGCGSPRLLELHKALYDQAYRYRAVMLKRVEGGRQYFYEGHQALAQAVLSRDAGFASKMLSDHLGLTFEYVYPESSARKIDKIIDSI